MEILEKIKSFLFNEIDFLSLGTKLGDWTPAVYIIAACSVVVLVAFFIALGIKAGSKTSKFRKHLDDTTAFVNAGDDIDETNVEGLNARIQDARMPRSVAKGWGNFLDQQAGYPSDYITEKDAVGDRKSCNFKAGKGFYNFVSWLVIVVAAGLAAVLHFDIIKNTDWSTAKSVADGVMFVLPILGTVVIPLVVYIIFSAFLGLAGRNQYKKTVKSFRKFQDAIDGKVVIFREPQDEFIAENIDEINSAIDVILANKLGDSEIIDIVTTPSIPEENAVEEVEAPVAEAPATADVKEEVVAEVATEPEAPAMAEEVRQSHFVELVNIVARLLGDPNATEYDVIKLGEYFVEVKEGGLYNGAEEQEILQVCLETLAGFYYDKYGRNDA